ncbi:MAG TPA: SMI1/KNR4 family protein [Pyrinomonadaceae bacterium]|nr:SMI1/KNR4 family protein [Pyrinomonadaceae bacterium]
MEFTSAGESLKRHWSSHNVEINAGVSEARLKAFEEKYSVVLPDDLRDYFRCVNGMAPDEVDDGMIRFWMLEEIEPLPQSAPQYSDGTYVQNPETLFLFADYSLWAHAYAIHLENTELESNEVIIIGYESPKLISDSFSKFVGTYLTSKDLLH